MTIVLIACSKAKLPHNAKARELYQGVLFKKCLYFAQNVLCADKIFILSAKHHLLDLSKIITPYDKTVAKMTKAERVAWSQKVVDQLKNLTNTSEDQFVILAGKKYREFIESHLGDCMTPLKNMGIGEQLGFLKEMNKQHVVKTLQDI